MIKKVISGGQTGADIGGLIAASMFDIETGGCIPKGCITQSGPKPEWKEKYNLYEHSLATYAPRTFENVKKSDGTIRIAGDFDSAGEVLTLKAIKQYKKPHFDVNIISCPRIEETAKWIEKFNIEVLNIAGNSEKTWEGITGETIEFLRKLFRHLGFKEVN